MIESENVGYKHPSVSSLIGFYLLIGQRLKKRQSQVFQYEVWGSQEHPTIYGPIKLNLYSAHEDSALALRGNLVLKNITQSGR